MTSHLYDFAQDVVRRCEAGLTHYVERALVSYGAEVAWDEGSQLSVRLLSVTPNVGVGDCVTSFQITYIVEVLRCVANLDNGGRPPSVDEQQYDADVHLQDVQDINRVLLCEDFDPHDIRLDITTPLGPSGGYAGVAVQFTTWRNSL